jgi:glycosyltransferase involved in cell wall biosynthesis
MKIILASSFVPFVQGGYRNIVEWLDLELRKRGHETLKLYLPQRDDPDVIVRQCRNLRKIELPKSDLLITFRPQAHLLKHSRKVVWFIHHMRAYYDLWNSEYRGFELSDENLKVRQIVHDMDNEALYEAQRIYSNSSITSNRLKKFNGIESEILYPPIYEDFPASLKYQNNEIIYLSRVENHKRQHLFFEALAQSDCNIIGRVIGKCESGDYKFQLEEKVKNLGIANRVIFDDRWHSEEEKINYVSKCLAVAYFPMDEDSYGYPILEAASQNKPVVTCTDSGGTLEIIKNGVNGLIVEPSAEKIADAFNFLHRFRIQGQYMGDQLRESMYELGISWEKTIGKLLA